MMTATEIGIPLFHKPEGGDDFVEKKIGVPDNSINAFGKIILQRYCIAGIGDASDGFDHIQADTMRGCGLAS